MASTMEIRERIIVSFNPPSRNLIFVIPCAVLGEITYQPQLPLSPAQPETIVNVATTSSSREKILIRV